MINVRAGRRPATPARLLLLPTGESPAGTYSLCGEPQAAQRHPSAEEGAGARILERGQHVIDARQVAPLDDERRHVDSEVRFADAAENVGQVVREGGLGLLQPLAIVGRQVLRGTGVT